MHLMRRAFCLALANEGKSMLARMPMIAITTSISMRVKARRERVLDGAMTVLVASVSDVLGSWEFFIVDSTHGHPDFCQVRDSFIRALVVGTKPKW